MMMKHFKNSFLTFKVIHRTYSSALYITGDKAQNTCVVLRPVIDFDKQITNITQLKQNIEARGLQINTDDIVKSWLFYQDILKRKHKIEIARAEVGQNVSNLIKNQNADPMEINRLKLHAKVLKEDLKNLKESSYDIEANTMMKILSLPNVLHHKTPLVEENIVHTHLKKPLNDSLSHMKIGEDMNYLKYLDPFTCYLKSHAALFELKILNWFKDVLINLNCLQFSNPNFCRSVISEGCDNHICHSAKKMFTLEEQNHEEYYLNKLHLCGSATLYSFMAYFARHLLLENAFPLKYFSVGKLYQPVKNDVTRNLFNLSQHTNVNFFIANLEDSFDIVDYLVEQIINIYNTLGVHYRISILPATEIDNSESLRISIQMYSNFEKKYVEIGNVSLYDSYISKRLLLTYVSNKQKRYPNIASGSIFNFHKFLGCILENFDEQMLSKYLMFTK